MLFLLEKIAHSDDWIYAEDGEVTSIFDHAISCKHMPKFDKLEEKKTPQLYAEEGRSAASPYVLVMGREQSSSPQVPRRSASGSLIRKSAPITHISHHIIPHGKCPSANWCYYVDLNSQQLVNT